MDHALAALLAISEVTPDRLSQQANQTLRELAIWLVVVFGLAILAAIIDWLMRLMEPLQALGVQIKFWPTFIGLLALAIIFAGPEIHEYVDDGHTIYASARMDTLSLEGMNEIMLDPLDTCKIAEGQAKMNEASAEANEMIGNDKIAEQIRNSQTIPSECPSPSPIPQ